ncbi:hypothetical protein Dxin01_03828 [Deinococcus xinjiangensis]|uniref:Uncharacterized protein n=1 Tax=Deinococcus xinjiangensis TaxID=457454 RepID=A0ABP9VFQ7_9DEIO
MKPNRIYLLEKDGVTLGQITIDDIEMFAFHGSFEPTPEYENYRALFEEDSSIFHQMNEFGETEELTDKNIEFVEKIVSLGLTLRRVGGGIYRQAIISIDGHRAGFRPLDPEEEPL